MPTGRLIPSSLDLPGRGKVLVVDDSSAMRMALEAGAIDVLVKPFRPEVVAARVRNHVELKRRRDRIKQQSLVDGLTGLAKRRRFDETLLECWSACAQGQKPQALILLDGDFFKRYSDRFGHPQGDACLQAEGRNRACG